MSVCACRSWSSGGGGGGSSEDPAVGRACAPGRVNARHYDVSVRCNDAVVHVLLLRQRPDHVSEGSHIHSDTAAGSSPDAGVPIGGSSSSSSAHAVEHTDGDSSDSHVAVDASASSSTASRTVLVVVAVVTVVAVVVVIGLLLVSHQRRRPNSKVFHVTTSKLTARDGPAQQKGSVNGPTQGHARNSSRASRVPVGAPLHHDDDAVADEEPSTAGVRLWSRGGGGQGSQAGSSRSHVTVMDGSYSVSAVYHGRVREAPALGSGTTRHIAEAALEPGVAQVAADTGRVAVPGTSSRRQHGSGSGGGSKKRRRHGGKGKSVGKRNDGPSPTL